jgi:glycosyltransferase involved in cell wall biosynthesis
MFKGNKIVVVMPAYNAEKTLRKTHSEVLNEEIVDLVLVVDDKSTDRTVEIAKSLPKTKVHCHPLNKGYGYNQKNCYKLALGDKADIIIMVHPDYQYTPKLIPAMVALISSGLYNCVIGSRILGGYALQGNMPKWKYIGNRFLTLLENLITGAKLSEYHSGYRAYSSSLLKRIPFEQNSDDFIFDNQIIMQIVYLGERIAEITCPANYSSESSSIGLTRSVKYGIGCLSTAIKYKLHKLGLIQSRLFRLGDASIRERDW